MALTPQIGYCTNVHAGANLDETRANLQRYALAVKRRFRPDRPMGLGLWLSAQSARHLLDDQQLEAFAAWLHESGLVAFTLNGFPYGNFHQRVVKHAVYLPTWWDPLRMEYTRHLIRVLDRLLPPGAAGSISTLPIAWGSPAPAPDALDIAAGYLRQLADELADLEDRSGRLIHVDLEPEPGCVLQTSDDVVRFFDRYVSSGADTDRRRRYLRVCHDVCHAAVMFEQQDQVWRRYSAAAIRVGKVQISSAVRVPFQSLDLTQGRAARAQLAAFAEDRYLHQTTVELKGGDPPAFYQDLPEALAEHASDDGLGGEWRIHFHVPVYLARFGWLETSQLEIQACLAAAARLSDVEHFEVETYAWGVLPAELQQPDLATGIVRELEWFEREQQQMHCGVPRQSDLDRGR
jgi:sugar phosphate isomerase/epimerase